MSASLTEKEIKTYFSASPKWPFVLIGLGVMIAVCGGVKIGPLLVGVLVAGGGIAALVMGMKGPSDEEIDKLTEAAIQKATKRSLDKSGIDASQTVRESEVITGLTFWSPSASFYGTKVGKDKLLRFTPIDVTVLNFGEHQLFAYKSDLDLVSGNLLNESTDEFFYKDIVSVSTKTDTLSYVVNSAAKAALLTAGVKLPGNQLQLNSAENFVLTTSGGTSVKVILRDASLMGKGGNIPTTRAEKAIQAVRSQLRAKKQA